MTLPVWTASSLTSFHRIFLLQSLLWPVWSGKKIGGGEVHQVGLVLYRESCLCELVGGWRLVGSTPTTSKMFLAFDTVGAMGWAFIFAKFKVSRFFCSFVCMEDMCLLRSTLSTSFSLSFVRFRGFVCILRVHSRQNSHFHGLAFCLLQESNLLGAPTANELT